MVLCDTRSITASAAGGFCLAIPFSTPKSAKMMGNLHRKCRQYTFQNAKRCVKVVKLPCPCLLDSRNPLVVATTKVASNLVRSGWRCGLRCQKEENIVNTVHSQSADMRSNLVQVSRTRQSTGDLVVTPFSFSPTFTEVASRPP